MLPHFAQRRIRSHRPGAHFALLLLRLLLYGVRWPPASAMGQRALIVCGELLKAIRLESVSAIVQAFGVSPVTVARWRRVLGVPVTTVVEACR